MIGLIQRRGLPFFCSNYTSDDGGGVQEKVRAKMGDLLMAAEKGGLSAASPDLANLIRRNFSLRLWSQLEFQLFNPLKCLERTVDLEHQGFLCDP